MADYFSRVACVNLGASPKAARELWHRPELLVNRDTKPGLLRPTTTFDGERKSFKVSGVEFELVFAPGETFDQIFVWLPKYKALLPGDILTGHFQISRHPWDLYRDVMDWACSRQNACV